MEKQLNELNQLKQNIKDAENEREINIQQFKTLVENIDEFAEFKSYLKELKEKITRIEEMNEYIDKNEDEWDKQMKNFMLEAGN